MKVVHCKKEPYDVYIGRPSKWGNPFTHKAGIKNTILVASREAAVRMYEEWINSSESNFLINDVHELKGKTLGCWCAPQACHGDVLLKLANK